MKVKPWPVRLMTGIAAEQAEKLWPRDPSFRPDKLRLARQARGYSMRELADRSGVTARRISMLEHNRDVPTDDERQRLCTALHFPDSFFGRDDPVIDFRGCISGRYLKEPAP